MLAEPRHYNRVGLSAAGHTLAAYRRREQGWSPAPAGLWTDLHFWRGFVADESFTCRSLDRVTVLNFASPVRAEVDATTRATELQAWAKRISDPGGREAVDAEIDAAYRANAVVQDLEYRKVHDWLLDAQRLAGDLAGRGDRLEREAARSTPRLPNSRLTFAGWRRCPSCACGAAGSAARRSRPGRAYVACATVAVSPARLGSARSRSETELGVSGQLIASSGSSQRTPRSSAGSQ